jgi:hypothetical protein
MKAVLRGKLLTLLASIKKVERAYTNRLPAHMKALEQKEANPPKRSRPQDIIKLKLMGYNEIGPKRKTHSSEYLQKETGEGIH